MATEATEDPTEYFAANDQYPALDAWLLEGLLRYLRPARMIEVGSGFSSLVTARVNREFLWAADATSPASSPIRGFLREGVPGISALRVEKIQDTPARGVRRARRQATCCSSTPRTRSRPGATCLAFGECCRASPPA